MAGLLFTIAALLVMFIGRSISQFIYCEKQRRHCVIQVKNRYPMPKHKPDPPPAPPRKR